MTPNPTHTEGSSLADALPREMARVTALISIYASIGPAGNFAIAMMRKDLDDAAKAIMSGDVVEMIRVYRSLKETDS